MTIWETVVRSLVYVLGTIAIVACGNGWDAAEPGERGGRILTVIIVSTPMLWAAGGLF